MALSKKLFPVFLGVFMCLLMPAALAQVNINAVVREITPGQRPIENVEVSNHSDNRILQVNISAAEVTMDENFEETQNPSDDLLIAPKTMILRPGEKKQARVVLRKQPGDTERYYRVKFNAKIPDPIRMKALELTDAEQEEQDEINASIVMVSGVGMFLTVAPQDPKPRLTWERGMDEIVFKNEGNTSITMRARKNYCYDGDKCINLPSETLFPGEAWTFKFPAEQPLVYYYKVYDKTKKAVIGAVE